MSRPWKARVRVSKKATPQVNPSIAHEESPEAPSLVSALYSSCVLSRSGVPKEGPRFSLHKSHVGFVGDYDLRMNSHTVLTIEETCLGSMFIGTSFWVCESAGSPFSSIPMMVIERTLERMAGVASVSRQP